MWLRLPKDRKNGIVNCILNPGDVIIFDHLIVHGSASNTGPRSRKAIVLQARSKIKEKNMKIFNKESKYRKKFVENSLTKIISDLSKKNLYSDLKRKKSWSIIFIHEKNKNLWFKIW